MLRQLQTIEVPSWLINLTPNAIMHAPLPLHELLCESLYYPSSGFDGDPIKHLGGNVLSFVYVDYGHTHDAFVSALRFTGYDLVAHRFVAWNELSPDTCRPLELRRGTVIHCATTTTSKNHFACGPYSNGVGNFQQRMGQFDSVCCSFVRMGLIRFKHFTLKTG